jgi:transposase-like protein
VLYERGVVVSYETIRQWCTTFGHEYARRPRHHLFTAADYRNEMKSRFTIWKQITGTTTVPQAT